MPDIISHWLMGRRICRDSFLSGLFPEAETDAFLWGCQGPDILFYHRSMPWQTGSLRSYGSAMHKGNPSTLLRSLAKVCRYCADREDYNLIYSYALGFCSHYCYDRTVHPLVYYNIELLEKTDERGINYKYHNVIENNLDVMLLLHDTGRRPDEISLSDCLPACEGIKAAAAVIYSLLICDLYGLHTPRKSAVTLAGDFSYAISLRNDSHFLKKPIAEAAEKLLPYVRPGMAGGVLSGKFHPRQAETDFDYGNMTGSMWFNPHDRSSRSSRNFFELTDMAQVDSMRLMELFEKEVARKGSGDFDKFTDGINFSGQRVE